MTSSSSNRFQIHLTVKYSCISIDQLLSQLIDAILSPPKTTW